MSTNRVEVQILLPAHTRNLEVGFPATASYAVCYSGVCC